MGALIRSSCSAEKLNGGCWKLLCVVGLACLTIALDIPMLPCPPPRRSGLARGCGARLRAAAGGRVSAVGGPGGRASLPPSCCAGCAANKPPGPRSPAHVPRRQRHPPAHGTAPCNFQWRLAGLPQLAELYNSPGWLAPSACRYLDNTITHLRKGIAKAETPPKPKKGEPPLPARKVRQWLRAVRGRSTRERGLHGVPR